MTKIHEVPNLKTSIGDSVQDNQDSPVFDIVYNLCSENERLILSLIKLHNIKSYLVQAQSAPRYAKHWNWYTEGVNTIRDVITSQETVLYNVQSSKSYYYQALNKPVPDIKEWIKDWQPCELISKPPKDTFYGPDVKYP